MTSENEVIIIARSPFFYEGLRDTLRHHGLAVLPHAHNLPEALEHLNTAHPHVAVTDPLLAEHESLAICRALHQHQPNLRIILLLDHSDDELLLIDAAHAGAAACLPCETTPPQLLAMLTTTDQPFFSSQIRAEAHHNIELTTREQDVLRLMVEGKRDREIACALVIAYRTARNHAQHILEKLSVHDRHEAIRRAKRRGLV